MTPITTPTALTDVTPQWGGDVAIATSELWTMGPAAIAFLLTGFSGSDVIGNWDGGYAQCQVMRFGDTVQMVGLAKTNQILTPGGATHVAIVPAGYRPRRATGSPLGGIVITAQMAYPEAAGTTARVDINPNGFVTLIALYPAGNIAANVWFTLVARWRAE